MIDMNRRRALMTSLAALSVPQAFTPAFAQSDKLTRIITAFPPGGGVDTAVRPIAQGMASAYPGGLIVETKIGASGRVAADYVKSSPPDGTTMFFTTDFTLTLVPYTFKKVNFDPLTDFAPVAVATQSPLILCVGPAVPSSVKTVANFLDWCKANPAQAAFASSSAGAATHFAGVMFAKASGVPLLHVPYKGGLPALTDVMGGQIACVFSALQECLARQGDGRLRPLASTGAKRSDFMPNVPTMTELGYPDVVTEPWLGFFMPAKTPEAIIRKTSALVNEALRAPVLIEAYAKQGTKPKQSTPESTAALLKADYERWGRIVKASGFTAEE